MRKGMKWLALLLTLIMGMNAALFAMAEETAEWPVDTQEAFGATDEVASEEEAATGEQSNPEEELEQPETSDEPEEPTETETSDESEAPAEQETPVEDSSDAVAMFSAQVSIRLANEGQLYYGDSVRLEAEVTEANGEYTVCWQYYEEANIGSDVDPWVTIAIGDAYTMIVTEENAALTYRVVLEDTVFSAEFRLPEVMARPDEEPMIEDEPETEDELAAEEEPETTEEDLATEEEPEIPMSLEDMLDPNRNIQIHAEWNGERLHFGDTMTMVAELNGYDNAVYTLQWMMSVDGAEWVQVDGATEARYEITVTEDNWRNFWRVDVTVTDVLPG